MFVQEKLLHHSPHSALSPRQLEVLRGIWNGLDSKMIAEQLGITQKGLEYHKGNIFRKWECDNVMQVIRLALRRGILEV
ncbi:MAG TPA: LuxR C-terminal-related transcriptional regulator [Nitrospiraceae bacterium]|nr:LuxR C-terminal-related transcriptional regulator [Nitrospiraceae bacterium]